MPGIVFRLAAGLPVCRGFLRLTASAATVVGDVAGQTQEDTPERGQHSHPPHGPGRLARPDRNRRPFLPDVQCAACKRVGHVANHCDMLAAAICLERYMKADLSPALCDSIEQEWIKRWKEQLGNPTLTPRQVLRAYVEDLDITVAGLDEEMEWDAWVDCDFDTPADE